MRLSGDISPIPLHFCPGLYPQGMIWPLNVAAQSGCQARLNSQGMNMKIMKAEACLLLPLSDFPPYATRRGMSALESRYLANPNMG